MKAYSGVFTALITPFRNGFVDELALERLVEWQISSGIDGLVLFGSTGESSTVTIDECKRILSIVQEVNKSRVRIIVGSSSNSTRNVIEKINMLSSNSDCALVSSPYYNKPTQEGIYLHFKEIYESTNFPVIVYDIPSRCAISIKDETMIKIIDLPNIVALKDASGNIARPLILAHPKISILCSDDITSLAHYVYGADGIISVTSNVFPKKSVELYKAFFSHDIETAMKINKELFNFNTSMFVETNPIPVKYALSLLKDYILLEYRLPLIGPSEFARNVIECAFKEFVNIVDN